MAARRPVLLWWRETGRASIVGVDRMELSPKLQFILGFLRHPSRIWHGLREMSRIAAAPSLDKAIPAERFDVDVIPVIAGDSLGQRILKIYASNH